MLSNLLQSSLAGMSADAASRFTAGYLYGITSLDKTEYIVKCFKDDADLNNIMDAAMGDMKRGDADGAQKEWAKTEKLYEAAMADCNDVAKSFQDLEQYKEDVLARKDAKEFLEANYKKYQSEIEKSMANEVGQWDLGVYFNSGMFAGYSMQYYGLAPPRGPPSPTPSPTPTPDPKQKRDSSAPGQFVAGWFYGTTNEDKRDDIMQCYKVSDDLTNTLYDAMEAYAAGDQKTGDAKMKDTRPLYDDALKTCDEKIGEAMGKIADQADALVKRKDWDTIAKQIYDDNKVMIDRDVDLEIREWKQGVFFNSGMFAGYVEEIFLKNAPAEQPKNEYSLFAPF